MNISRFLIKSTIKSCKYGTGLDNCIHKVNNKSLLLFSIKSRSINSKSDNVNDLNNIINPSSLNIDTSSINNGLLNTSAADIANTVAQTPELGNSITHVVIYAIESLHQMTGLPYWETILAITISLRILLIPIGIKAVINAARMALLRPDMQKVTDAFNNDPNNVDIQVKTKFKNEMQALFVKHKVNPFQAILMPLIQAPLFMSFFFALQSMGTYIPAIATGGAFWFVDLTVPDPYYIFPVLNALSFLAMIEIGADGMQSDPNMQGAKWGMRGLALVIFPATIYIPQAVCVYWTANNIFSILQTLALKTTFMKKLFQIPDLPKTAPPLKIVNPFSTILESLKDQGNKKQDVPPPPPVLTFNSHPKIIKKSKVNNDNTN